MADWHEGLTLKQRRFCEHYASNGGNATRAAAEAGYKQPHPQGAENLQKPTIQAALDLLQKSTNSEAIATREERQSFWTAVMRDEEISMRDRLKASEQLGRSQADFVERHEVGGPNGGPIVFSSREEEDRRLAELLQSAGLDIVVQADNGTD